MITHQETGVFQLSMQLWAEQLQTLWKEIKVRSFNIYMKSNAVEQMSSDDRFHLVSKLHYRFKLLWISAKKERQMNHLQPKDAKDAVQEVHIKPQFSNLGATHSAFYNQKVRQNWLIFLKEVDS